MKRFFLMAVGLVSSMFVASAQFLPVSPRLEVSVSASRQTTSFGKDTSFDSKAKLGFRVGAAAELSLADMIYIAPGLVYKTEGAKYSKDQSSSKSLEYSNTIHYLSIPVNLGIRAGLGIVTVSVEAGPYFAYALKGNSSIAGMSYNLYKKVDNIFSSDKNKRFDMGVGASVAVEFNKLYVRLGTDLGLYNTSDPEFIKSKNSSAYLGVGFRF